MAKQAKDQAVRELAASHYLIDPGIVEIYRLLSTPEAEKEPQEPIKLLEVNKNAVALGIRPVFFGPDAEIEYPSVVVDLAPSEFRAIRDGKLGLPNEWQIGERLPRHAAPAVVE